MPGKKGVSGNPKGRGKGIKETKPRNRVPSALKITPKGGKVAAVTPVITAKPQQFKKGNQLWQMRGAGRQTDFTPITLWEEFMEYCQWVDDNPWPIEKLKTVTKTISGVQTTDESSEIEYRKLPYSVGGFMVWIERGKLYLDQLKEAKSHDFSVVLDHIHDTIRTQQFDGAVANVFHAGMIARSLQMADTTIIQDQRTSVANLFPTADEMRMTLDKKLDDNVGQ